MVCMQNFYQVLGVPSDADHNRIKTAYRALAMSCHPDRNTSDRAAADRFKIITEAYEALRDPQSRAAYDFGLIHAQSALRARARRLRSAAAGGFILAIAVALFGGRIWLTQPDQQPPPSTSVAETTKPQSPAETIAASQVAAPAPDIDASLRQNLAALPALPPASELAERPARDPAAGDLDDVLRRNSAGVPTPPATNELAELAAGAASAKSIIDLESSLRDAVARVPQPEAVQDLLPPPAPTPKAVIVQYRPASAPPDLADLLEPLPQVSPLDPAALAWAALQDSRDIAALGTFVANFEHTPQARLARARIAVLATAQTAPEGADQRPPSTTASAGPSLAQGSQPTAAPADDPVATIKPGNWTVLRSGRYQFVLKYPANIFPTTIRSNATERRLVSRDGLAELMIYAARTPPGLNLQSIRQSIIDERYSAATFDYGPVGKTWFVLSGLNGEDTFYERVTVSCDEHQMHGWRLTYPTGQRKLYERVVEDMHRTYRHASSACTEHKRAQQAAELRDPAGGIVSAQQLGR